MINRILILVISLLSIIISLVLRMRVRGSAHERIIGHITMGFVFIAAAKLVAVGTMMCLENAILPKSYSWIMQVYEVVGLVGLALIVMSVWMLLTNRMSLKK
ncbi:MAG TPA: hypothetical protein PKV16_07105 [Caldisericia bacterium]|nr:hypothetical protein [Caldisericia bacterium]HPF49536.1 hypothetical protein [Caldisericia bacterium]HPI84170.1 hypothetical protein [Caldisericia bacterium]HPQ93535.1 hypothetical protein [Caldisericia bacterium]HRV75459.1 hypothetical protein [Caldisericia bacterium]